MKHHLQINRYHSFLAAIFVMVMLLSVPAFVFAQATATPSGTTIEISGIVSEIGTETIVVAGLTVDITGITLDPNITVGTTVTVKGQLLPTSVVAAESITIVNTTATPTKPSPQVTASATSTPDSDVIIVVEGPVQNININIITIYNINIEIDVNNPILNIIQIGDVIYVEGVMGDEGVLIASVINNLAEVEEAADGASVGIQGPIEAIEGNRVTVNGIIVEFDPNDPMLATLVVGNFLDVQGNFVFINNVYILIVVNVIIINDIDINVPEYCWWHNDGMGMGMGHWHCDGMGMGPGMGMGMGN